MDKTAAQKLWNQSMGNSFGGEWGGDINMNALGGAALHAGVPTFIPCSRQGRDNDLVAAFLRDWADAIANIKGA